MNLQRIRSTIGNTLWFLDAYARRPSIAGWRTGVRERQEKTLLTLLEQNRESKFGRRHQFSDIDSIEAYRNHVPITEYEDYRDAVHRIHDGERHVLTGDRVRKLEPTGGTSGDRKLIPYTDELLRRFQTAIRSWIYHLFKTYPDLITGRAYWSLSPVHAPDDGDGSVPVGFDNDQEYLSDWMQNLISQILAVPPDVKQIQDMEAFRYVTLLFLLDCRDLKLVSVWNPTFLSLLLEPLDTWWNRLLTDLARGSLDRCPGPLSEKIKNQLEPRRNPSPERARELARIRTVCRNQSNSTASASGKRTIYERIWPELSVISCWADGHAKRFVPALKEQFPHVDLQPKGLVATEGIVSFPVGKEPGSLPALNSHFFEFIETDTSSSSPPLTADRLETGNTYSVLLTNGGGLYRYRLFDRVHVIDHLGACPVLQFAGKEDHVSDLFGEKLHERRVRTAVRQALDDFSSTVPFWFVAPAEVSEDTHAYTLFGQFSDCPDSSTLRKLARTLEDELQKNYSYRYSRKLNQLAPARVFHIQTDFSSAIETFHNVNRRCGRNPGDVKSTGLHSYRHWHREFQGQFDTDPERVPRVQAGSN